MGLRGSRRRTTIRAEEISPETGEEVAVGPEEDTDSSADQPGDGDEPRAVARRKPTAWTRLLVFSVLPALAMMLALGAALAKWQFVSRQENDVARVESVGAATEGTIKMLSYDPATVDTDLGSARERLTGSFRDAYTQLVDDVVIPGAKQKKISAVANVSAAASVSATASHAVVLVFVNQNVTQGNDAPSNTASSVQVTLDKQGNRWLISDFTPI